MSLIASIKVGFKASVLILLIQYLKSKCNILSRSTTNFSKESEQEENKDGKILELSNRTIDAFEYKKSTWTITECLKFNYEQPLITRSSCRYNEKSNLLYACKNWLILCKAKRICMLLNSTSLLSDVGKWAKVTGICRFVRCLYRYGK